MTEYKIFVVPGVICRQPAMAKPSEFDACALIHRSPLGDVQIPEAPVTEIVLRHAGQLANKPALIKGLTGRLFTYSTLAESRTQAGGRLEKQGIRQGRCAGSMAPHFIEFAAVFHGAAMAGGTITTLNPTCTEKTEKEAHRADNKLSEAA